MAATSRHRYHGIEAGYRSGLEEIVAADLKRRGVDAKYEKEKIKYDVPSRPATYTPDFVIRKSKTCLACRGYGNIHQPTGERDECGFCNGTGKETDILVIETKGRFTATDRKKHLLIKAQHPDLDIRFLFQRSASRLSKKSKTTYADWCRKHGFQFADKVVPDEWLKGACGVT